MFTKTIAHMTGVRRIYLFVIAAILNCLLYFPQTSRIDSLRAAASSETNDTAKLKTLNLLASEYKFFNPDSAFYFVRSAAAILKRAEAPLDWKLYHAGRCFNLYGTISGVEGNSANCERYLLHAMKAWSVAERSPGKFADAAAKMQASGYTNLGNLKTMQGDYPRALEYFFKAQTLCEKFKHKSGLATVAGNIGTVYKHEGETDKALQYFLKSVELKDSLDDEPGVVSDLNNIAAVYFDKGDFRTALDYFERSLKRCEASGNYAYMSIALTGIGNVLVEQKEYKKALPYYSRALEMETSSRNSNEKAQTLSNVGTLYYTLGDYKQAKKCLTQSLLLAIAIGKKRNLERNYKYLSKVDSATGDYRSAYENYKMSVAYRDSLTNEENTKKQTQLEMQFEFDKKDAETKAAQAKKDAVAEEERRRQGIVLWCVVAGLTLVFCFAVFIFRAYSQKKKANVEISRQKNIIEMKQKEILDSIHYAKRIQVALLAPEKYVARVLRRLNSN